MAVLVKRGAEDESESPELVSACCQSAATAAHVREKVVLVRESAFSASDDFFRLVTIAVRVVADGERVDRVRSRARLREEVAIAVLVVLWRLLVPILSPLTVVALTGQEGRSHSNYRAKWATRRKGWVKKA